MRFMHLIYAIRWLVVLYVSGTIVYNSSFFRKIPRENRFIVGITSAPLFIAFYHYIVGLLWPGAPVFIFRYGVLILSLLYLAYHKNYLVGIRLGKDIYLQRKRIMWTTKAEIWLSGIVWLHLLILLVIFNIRGYTGNEDFGHLIYTYKRWGGFLISALIVTYILFNVKRFSWQGTVQKMTIFVVAAAGMFILSCLISTSISNIYDYMPGWDEAHYEMQARFFAEDRNSWEIDNYKGDKAGAVLADDHGPLWEVFIADANFFANDAINDGLVRASHSFIGLLFFIALYNWGCVLAGSLCGILSVMLLLFYRYSLSFLFDGAREPFRFIALYFFVFFIYSEVISIIEKEEADGELENKWKAFLNNIKKFVSILIISYLGMNGHGSNVVLMFGIMLFYTAIAIWKRIGIKEYFITASAVLLGVLLVLEKNIRRYFAEGSFISSSTYAFRGTRAAELTKKAYAERGNWEVIWSSFTSIELILVILGGIALIFIALYCNFILRKKNGKEMGLCSKSLINVGISIGMLLPLTGIYDILGYQFSLWLVEQLRYRMVFLVLFSVLGAELIAIIYMDNDVRGANGIAIALILSICVISVKTTRLYNRFPKKENYFHAVETYHRDVCEDILANYHTTGNIFVSDQMVQYFFRIPTKLGFVDYNHSILAAKTYEEVEAAIDSLDMEVFVFCYNDVDSRGISRYNYDVLPFYDYLNNSPNILKQTYYIGEAKDYEINVYKIDDLVWNRSFEEGN